MSASVPEAVLQQTMEIMKGAEVVVFDCRQEGSTVIGKGEDILQHIVASKTSKACRMVTLQVENEDVAAFLIAFYKTSPWTVH